VSRGSRISRGIESQEMLASYLQGRGWPLAIPSQLRQPGRDVRNTPGLSFEVKATSAVPLLAALRQANRNAGPDIPVVVWRPDGYGLAKIGQWVLAMDLEQGLRLLPGYRG
jgi:hypothetical protein